MTFQGTGHSVRLAREITAGVAPATGWHQLAPLATGGVTGNITTHVSIMDESMSPTMMNGKPVNVDKDASPTLTFNLKKSVLDFFLPAILRSAPVTPWNGAQVLYGTAAVDGGAGVDSFTVAGAPVLPAGTLIHVIGSANAANNGVLMLAAGSTATALNVATGTLVAETNNLEIRVCGFHFGAGDLQVNASNNLTSTTQNLTVFGLQPGQPILVGGTVVGQQFATLGGKALAYVADVVTANLIPLDFRSKITARNVSTGWAGADAGAAKTIRIWFGPFIRNLSIEHTSLIAQPSWHMESRYTNGVAAEALFTYTEQMVLNQTTLTLGINQAVTMALQFHASGVTDPVLDAGRVAGPSTANEELATSLFDATCGMWLSRVLQSSDGATLIAEVNASTITLALGGQARKQLANCGSVGYDFGYFMPTISLSPYFERASTMAAVSSLTDCRYESMLTNGQGAVLVHAPMGTLMRGGETISAGQPVTEDMTFTPRPHPETGIGISLAVFPYVPW
ncbi:MAG: phage tail tube protein [Acidobacteriota bacterium]|nr:phage tail tube protein [Acidobacteriota bacterium]